MRKFNINEYIYVQINELGWEHLRNTVGEDYIKHCIKTPNYEKLIDGEVWHRTFLILVYIFFVVP